MSPENVEYYRRRATQERTLALAASQADVAAIHLELAKLYQALIDNEELRPILWISMPARSKG